MPSTPQEILRCSWHFSLGGKVQVRVRLLSRHVTNLFAATVPRFGGELVVVCLDSSLGRNFQPWSSLACPAREREVSHRDPLPAFSLPVPPSNFEPLLPDC